MTTAAQMLETYPRDYNLATEPLARCIDACYECAKTCTLCADDCLSEDNVAGLLKCIRLNLDCADVCVAAGAVMSRQTEYDANVSRTVLEACAQTCASCADECERHAQHHEHCRICADSCRRCEAACRELTAEMASS